MKRRTLLSTLVEFCGRPLNSSVLPEYLRSARRSAMWVIAATFCAMYPYRSGRLCPNRPIPSPGEKNHCPPLPPRRAAPALSSTSTRRAPVRQSLRHDGSSLARRPDDPYRASPPEGRSLSGITTNMIDCGPAGRIFFKKIRQKHPRENKILPTLRCPHDPMITTVVFARSLASYTA